jgi:hypothetical protein
MSRTIPTSFGLLTLSVFASGCSDAHKVAAAMEKVCDAQCECPESMEIWNDVGNCKDNCRGYSIQLEAFIEDQVDSEPCGELDERLDKLEGCTKKSCGDSFDECLSEAYYELYTCWNIFGGSYYYNRSAEGLSSSEIAQQLLYPIPGALDPNTLHSAAN